MHPAEEIMDAVLAAVLLQVPSTTSAFLHRSSSLEEAELPAVCVNYGEDTVDTAAQSLSELASSLEVVLAAVAYGDTETEVLALLLSLRSATHRAMASLAASSVWFVQYSGASAPKLEKREHVVGELTTRWLVRYVMNISDPE